MAKTFEALKHRNYRLWFYGQLVSLMGTWMQSTAQGFLVFQLTHSPAYLGYVALASGVPPWIFMLFAGVVSDRMSRRKLLIITQIVMMVLAFTMALLVASGLVEPWHIVLLSACLGVANAFDAPARQSFVVDMVPRTSMSNAIALNSTMFNAAAAIGPAIAGLVYAAIGPAWCFAVNGASFIAIIWALGLMQIKPDPTSNTEGASALEGIREGLKYVSSHPKIRKIVLNIVVLSLFGSAFITLIPAWAVQVLHGDALTAGLLQSARGFGSVVAALIVATVGHSFFGDHAPQRSTIILAVCLAGFSVFHSLAPALLLIACAGAALMMSMNLSNMLIQNLVSDRLRGRVMGIYNLAIFGLLPFGAFLGGIAAEHFGAPQTVFFSGVFMASIAMMLVRSLRG